MKHHVENVKAAILDRKKEFFLIFCLFLLAFGIRAYLMKYELFFEFDGYWHARVISYVIENGTYPAVDPLAYYQIGGASLFAGNDFFWWVNAAIYKLFTFGGSYVKETWYFFVKVLPALYGALACVAAYLLGKELFKDVKAGALFGFFTAVMPAFAYRQMAGWIEDDSFGWLPFVFGCFLLVKGLRETSLKKQLVWTAFSALSFTIMAVSWQGYQVVPLTLFGFAGLFVVYHFVNVLKKREDQQVTRSFLVGILTVSVLFTGLTFAVNETTWTQTAPAALTQYLPISKTNVDRLVTGSAGQAGEDSKGAPFFVNKYNVFIPYLFIPLMLVLLFLAFRKNEAHFSVLLAVAIVAVTFVMGYSKLKWTYYLGLGMAITMAIFFYLLWKKSHSWQSSTRKMVMVVTLFLVLTGAAAGSFFVTQNTPNIEYDSGWKQSLYWVEANTPVDSKFINWWDEGHWLTFIGQRKATLDNRNYDLNSAAEVAKFVITIDENEARRLILNDKYDPDYLIFDDGMLTGQQGLIYYAFGFFAGGSQDNPEIIPYQFAQGAALSCVKQTNALSGTVSYDCQGNQLGQEQWATIPTVWQSSPNQVSGREAIFVYRSEDREGNSKLYLLSPSTNESMMAKLWFNAPSVSSEFETVYHFKDVKVFKVK